MLSRRDVLFIETELAHGQTGDEIGAGAQLADGDFLAFEIGRLLDGWAADQDVVQFVAGGAENDEIFRALCPRENDSGTSLLEHRDIARDERLHRLAAAAHEDRQNLDAVFFKGAGALRHPEKIRWSRRERRARELL